jgi:hypothetical protein
LVGILRKGSKADARFVLNTNLVVRATTAPAPSKTQILALRKSLIKLTSH